MKRYPGKASAIIVTVIMIVSVSCRSGRNLSRERLPELTVKSGKLMSTLESRKGDFGTFKGKRTELEIFMNGESRKTRATIAVKRDSLIVISIVPALGFEMARVICTGDSVLIISRTDKSYAVSSFEEIGRKYGMHVDFEAVQSVLLNELFVYGEGNERRRYEKNISREKAAYLFLIEAFRGIDNISTQGFEFDAGNLSIRSMFLKDHSRNAGMNIVYDDFQIIEGISFPMIMEMNMMDATTRLELKLKYGSVEFNRNVNAGFEYPHGYSRVNMY